MCILSTELTFLCNPSHSVDPDLLVFFYFCLNLFILYLVLPYIRCSRHKQRKKSRIFIDSAPYNMQYQRQCVILLTEHYFFLWEKSQSSLPLCFRNHVNCFRNNHVLLEVSIYIITEVFLFYQKFHVVTEKRHMKLSGIPQIFIRSYEIAEYHGARIGNLPPTCMAMCSFSLNVPHCVRAVSTRTLSWVFQNQLPLGTHLRQCQCCSSCVHGSCSSVPFTKGKTESLRQEFQ